MEVSIFYNFIIFNTSFQTAALCAKRLATECTGKGTGPNQVRPYSTPGGLRPPARDYRYLVWSHLWNHYIINKEVRNV